MSRQGPIRFVLPPEEPVAPGEPVRDDVDEIAMPEMAVLKAGIAKFREYANLHWPRAGKPGEEFKLQSFDPGNDYHLRVTLGMVYLAMKAAEEASDAVPF